MSKKKPRFFCDNCGYEVGSDVKSCPYCGRFFASVRCPSCSMTGPDRMFQNGCPMCGYSAPPAGNTKPQKIKPSRKKKEYSEPLPFWTYAITFFILIVIVALFSWVITR